MKSQPALGLAVIGLFSQFSRAQTEVTWRNGDRLPDAMTPTAIREKAASWKTQHAQGGPRDRHVLVQFTDVVSSDRRDALASGGVHLLQPLGGNVFFAKIDTTQIDATNLERNHRISGLRDIQRTWKLHPKLIAGAPPPWAVVSRKADGRTPARIAVYVVLHPDVPRAQARLDFTNRHNMVVRSELASINTLVIELPAERVTALADEDAVQ